MKIDGSEILRQVVFVFLLVGILVGSWFLVFRPRDVWDTRMRQQIDAKQKQLQKLNRATATIGDLKAEIAELEKAVTFFHSKLPSEKEIDKVLEELWRLAENNNLAIKSINAMRRGQSSPFIMAGGPHAEQPIRMKFEGDFIGFYGFLLALEAQPRIMRIQKMTLNRTDAARGLVTVEMEMSVFFEQQTRSGKSMSWTKKT
jgi:Tfp pilus assembly protein PilO